VQELLTRFVPCADEVGRLQRADDPEAVFFRSFCDYGHYARRDSATGTRQGIYALTPSGKLLGSWNSRRVPEVLRQLNRALELWDGMEDAERYPTESLALGARFEDRYPSDGLVLLAYSRDLPRENDTRDPADWRTNAWNVDHVWFTARDAAQLADGLLGDAAARRLVRLHARDNVRGQTRPYPDTSITAAGLAARVVAEEGTTRVLELTGVAGVREEGEWRADDERGGSAPEVRSFEGTFYGTATWNGARFTSFELALVGPRTGATQYNERHDDRGPAPMGVVFRLAEPGDRVAPSMWYEYGRWDATPR
jgi:hypothetical protein